ncbi:hypothetical protein [Shinella sp. M31]|uniref:hypothetical protein n=1 Tax=Shinella sp. M31 TaxID=3368615 RepID=UPI003B9F904F
MRKFLLSAVIATLAAVSFAAPSQAGGFYVGFGGHHGWGGHHGGYVSHDYGHRRHCFWKKIKRYDYWGNLVIKRVKVCR